MEHRSSLVSTRTIRQGFSIADTTSPLLTRGHPSPRKHCYLTLSPRQATKTSHTTLTLNQHTQITALTVSFTKASALNHAMDLCLTGVWMPHTCRCGPISISRISIGTVLLRLLAALLQYHTVVGCTRGTRQDKLISTRDNERTPPA